MNKILCFLLSIFISSVIHAQQYDTASIFGQPIQIDSFVISSGFDVQAFIRRVETDTTFYKAFKSMRLVPYEAGNEIKVFDKDGSETASMHSNTRQERDKGCRITKIEKKNVVGDFYKKNGENNYYTAALFDHLFTADTPVCGETDVVGNSMEERGKGQIEKNTYELKQLIFNPGSEVSGIPFMGDRASIFGPGEADKYDFKIVRDTVDSIECLVFWITPKAGEERAVIYNELTTWFRRSDYSIVARNYSLSYHTLVYDFDVAMKVRTKETAGKLYPTFIDYDGNWHILTKKRERVKFRINIKY